MAMTKRNNTIQKSDPSDETATSATISATTAASSAVTACCPEEEKIRKLAGDYLKSNKNNNKKPCCAQPNYKTNTGTCHCDAATMNRVKNDALRHHAKQARHAAANCATIGTTIVVLVVLLLNASTLVSLFSLFFPAAVEGFVLPNPYPHHHHRTFGNTIDLLEHRMTSKMDSTFETTNGGSGEGDDPGVTRTKTTESSPTIIQVQEKVKPPWPPNDNKTEHDTTIDPRDAVFRGKSTMNKKEEKIVTFTDRLTVLMDTPFFDPDAYEEDDPTVLGKFATIIKQDYELFEAAFVACFFVVLIFIAQDLLRIQMMNSLAAGGGSGSHLF